MKTYARAILWLDSGAACAAGVTVLVFHDWLAQLYRFPPQVLMVMGAVNLLYGSYSGWLAGHTLRGQVPTRGAIGLLVFANLGWAAICATLFIAVLQLGNFFLLAHLALEGLFVGGLALAEQTLVRPLGRAGE